MIKVLINKIQIVFKNLWASINMGIDRLILVKLFFTYLFIRNWDLNNSKNLNIKDSLFSYATINGIDIHLRSDNFIYLISTFILVFFMCNIIINFISLKSKKTDDCIKADGYIDIISKFSIALLLVDMFTFKEPNLDIINPFPTGLLLSLLSLILLFIYQIINIFKEISLKNFSLNIAILSIIVFYLELRFNINLLSIYNIGLIVAMHFLIYLPIHYANHKKNLNQIIYDNLIIFSILPLVISLVVEVINIQIYKNSNFIDKNYAVDIVISIFFVVFFLLTKFKISLHRFTKYIFSIVLISFITFTLSPNYLISVIRIDNFETANHSISIYEYFKRGKIPILETFDAHFLNYIIWGVFYGFITRDVAGAVYVPYLFIGTVLGIFILFKILSKLYDDLTSMLLILIFPVYSEVIYMPNYQNMSYFINLSMIPILAACYVLKNPSKKRFLLFWVSILFSLSYRLDLGFAYSFSSILLIFIFFIYQKKESFRFIYTGILTFSFFSGVIVIFSYFKNINLLTRVQEILELITSDQFFGYTNLGLMESTYPLYKLLYFVLPIITVFLLIKLFPLYLKSSIEEKIKILLISFFGLSYLLNFPRSLVRHSLIESALSILLFTSIIFIPLAISYIYYKNRIEYFISTYLVILIVVHSLISIKFDNLLIENFGKKISDTSYLDNSSHRTRIQVPDDILLSHSNFKELRSVIKKPYTFINFTSYAVLPEVTDLESTSYTNQFPLLVTSEKMQNIYIKSVSNNQNVKFAVTDNYCNSLDSVNFHILYFNISEYINRNFIPKFKVNNFTIWVKKDFVENNYFTRLKSNIDQINVIDPTCNFKNNNILGYAPLIFQKNFSIGKEVKRNIFTSINSSYIISKEDLSIETRYSYLIQISASAKNESELSFNLKNKDEEKLSTYNLKVLKGSAKTYLIPISSNYNWFSNNFNHIEFNFSETDIKVESINIITTEPKYE